MAPEGRKAGAIFSVEGRKGKVFGQEGLVEVVALGMVADGAWHF